MAKLLPLWDDSSSEEHLPPSLLSSESDISGYYDPDEGWSDDELYALFGEEPEPMEEDDEEEKDEEDEDEDEDDDDDGGDNNSDGGDNGGGGDNDGVGDSGDEAVPPAKRLKKLCESSGAKDSY
jgi:hypothetical protein